MAGKGSVITTRYPGPFNPYPKEYNPRVHGPYDPSVNYRPNPRPSLWDVKLGNLAKHFLETDFSRESLANTVTRFFSRYHARHWRVRKMPIAPILQIMASGCVLFYLCTQGYRGGVEEAGGRISERRFKYH